MPVYSKKEFAALCGLKTKDLSVYVSRGKVLCNADGYVDTSNELNEYFLHDRRQKNVVKLQTATTATEDQSSGGQAATFFSAEMERLTSLVPSGQIAKIKNDVEFLVYDMLAWFDQATKGQLDQHELIDRSRLWVKDALKNIDDAQKRE